jgi:hypothetical protein
MQTDPHTPLHASPQTPPQDAPSIPVFTPAFTPFLTWLKRGIALGFLRRAEIAPGEQARPWHFALLLVIGLLIDIGLARLTVVGPAELNLWGLMPLWLFLPVLAYLLWLGFAAGDASPSQTTTVGNALVLIVAGLIPQALVNYVAIIIEVRNPLGLSPTQSAWWASSVYWLATAWLALAVIKVCTALDMPMQRAFWIALTNILVSVSIQNAWPGWIWTPVSPPSERAERMEISQDQFEAQADLLKNDLTNLAAQEPSKRDLYVLTYAPYSSEDVFWKESEMVRSVIGQRFDAANRAVSLINNPKTGTSYAWATPKNLERALQGIAAKMDREQDVLMIYLTSHGAQDFKLASDFWPLKVESLTPQALARLLDAAGIRHRIIAVSACYSGGWVEPLKNDHSLIMTAADATHTSYGCGRRSELTYFGRAVFDEQLRNNTRSFEEAFAAAVPMIKKREEEAGKDDGFSNPQLFVGPGIKDALKALEAAKPGP